MIDVIDMMRMYTPLRTFFMPDFALKYERDFCQCYKNYEIWFPWHPKGGMGCTPHTPIDNGVFIRHNGHYK